jgi:hypothetical protein
LLLVVVQVQVRVHHLVVVAVLAVCGQALTQLVVVVL